MDEQRLTRIEGWLEVEHERPNIPLSPATLGIAYELLEEVKRLRKVLREIADETQESIAHEALV